MKSNIEAFYRSITRPRPLWPEVALYGGYKFIELNENYWLPRTLEYLLLYAKFGENQELQTQAIRELNSSTKLFKPSDFQRSDYLKLLYTLSRQSAIAIIGYAAGLQTIIERLADCTIYTDSNYTTSRITKLTTEQICKCSSTMITLMPYTETSLKSEISNWGNVIVYDEDMLIETQTGGALCQTV